MNCKTNETGPVGVMDAPVQLSLLSAGCQPWNFQVVAASGQRCAYCATLSVYIYEVNIGLFFSYHSSLILKGPLIYGYISVKVADQLPTYMYIVIV